MSFALFSSTALPQNMAKSHSAKIRFIKKDFPVSQFNSPAWKQAERVHVSTYWNGKAAPASRSFSARLLWSSEFLYIHFEARQDEPLVISDKPVVDAKTMNLWDRDVCEIFLAPDERDPRKYLEFEVAPTGEWIDVGIDLTSGKRLSNWEFASGMETAAKIGDHLVTMAMKIPWKAFGTKPKTGDIWLGNLFRCVGIDPGRGYLAWSPTMTEQPNFHVSERFGEFEFVGFQD